MIVCQEFILRVPYISLNIMEDIRKKKDFSVCITLQNMIINMNAYFEVINRSEYPLGNYIY